MKSSSSSTNRRPRYRYGNMSATIATYKVTKEAELLEFLIVNMPERSRSAVKSYLSHRQIMVNERTTTSFNFRLKSGDIVEIKQVGETAPNPNHKVKILYEDDDIIVVDKKNGILTIATEKENERTAYSVMMEHVRRQKSSNRIFIVHRLDRDTSGLLIFAKSEDMQERLQNDWNETVEARTYVAIVEGRVEKDKGQIVSWLNENATSLKMSSSPVDNGGKKAITNYNVIKRTGHYSLIELNLETGRKNQIRIHMSVLGHPIAGDKKYGAQSNPLGRLCLHARLISFYHPRTGKLMSFDTGIPSSFQ